MNGIRKLEKDFAYADLSAVSSLLDQLGEEDVMTRLSLESRLEEIRETIARFDNEEEAPIASAALFFGGRPVIGARGIESEFGGEAVSKFQDLISKVLAHASGGLGQRGIVPNKSAATLHITNIARGSFGFILEEVQTQKQFIQSPLRAAVDEATHLLEALGEENEEHFRSAVEAIDQRILGTARDFFELMRQSGATLRLVTGDADRSFGAEAVARAAERATTTTLDESEENIRGRLAGVLPDSHQFEFWLAGDRGTVRGKVDRALLMDELAQFNRTWVNVEASARMRIKRVRHNNVVVREQFTLLRLEPA